MQAEASETIPKPEEGGATKGPVEKGDGDGDGHGERGEKREKAKL